MHKSFIPLVTPIISVCILTLGNGFFTTLTTMQLASFQLSTLLIGIISAAYFAGMLLGSFFSQNIIAKVGHIRAYSVFAALMSICCLFQGVISDPIIWGVLRFISGFALAGLFIVIESWCIAGVETQYKGRIMGFYLFSFYLAQAASQMFLKIHYTPELVAFCVISALACFSIIPVCLTRFDAPKPESPEFVSPIKYFKIIPLGIIAAFISGAILGGIYTMLPLAFKSINFTNSQIAYLMSITIFGGMLFQLPIGKISDLYDRRKVMFFVCVVIAVISIIICIFHSSYIQLFIFCFLIGSVSFAVYPLSISHSSDRVDISKSVAVISIITLFYGVGSMIGPLAATGFIDLCGGMVGFFLFIFVFSFILGAYILWRVIVKKSVDDSDKISFTAIAPRIAIGMAEVVEQNFNESLPDEDEEDKIIKT
ncbi:MAG TPA: MFS transporter [Victivallales bacterium]|nr:MFS transporter [Victivallales bacterium]